jgi:hypothetical protein
MRRCDDAPPHRRRACAAATCRIASADCDGGSVSTVMASRRRSIGIRSTH